MLSGPGAVGAPERVDEWVQLPRAGSGARMRLFCVPYAGGGPWTFRGFAEQLGATVEVCPIVLPGRAHRIGEPPLRTIPDIVAALARAIRPLLDLPFALLGHSFGAIVAFELARALRAAGAPTPLHLFVSAIVPPQEIETVLGGLAEEMRRLSDAEFTERYGTLALNGAALASSGELASAALPALRADSEALAGYRYGDEPPLPCAISVYAGAEDPYSPPATLDGWRTQTSAAFERRVVPGGHWFIETEPAPYLARVRGKLQRALRTTACGAGSGSWPA